MTILRDTAFSLHLAQTGTRTIEILDSYDRCLLSEGLILSREGTAAYLVDAEGQERWSDRLTGTTVDGELEEHIGGIVGEWQLAVQSVLTIRSESAEIRGADGKLRLAATLEVARSTLFNGEVNSGTLLSLDYHDDEEASAKRLLKTLRSSEGVPCPSPLHILIQRDALSQGWRHPEKVWFGNRSWKDPISLLIFMLRGVRDGRDRECVREARSIIRRLSVLSSVAAKNREKSRKDSPRLSLKALGDSLDPLRELDLLCEFIERNDKSADGRPGIGVDSPGLDSLVSELRLLRAETHERLCSAQRYLRDPDLLFEVCADWPAIPILEPNTDGGAFESAMRRRIRRISENAKAIVNDGSDSWQDLRSACRKFRHVLDAVPGLKKRSETVLLRKLAKTWQRRIGDFESARSNRALLARLQAMEISEAAKNAARALEVSLGDWIGPARELMVQALPALQLAARNTEGKIFAKQRA